MTIMGGSEIDPRIDVYGTDGRTGALADLLEFRATKGRGMSAADLADLIDEMSWTSKPTRQLIMDGDDEAEAAEPLAEQTFSLLAERSDVLGDRYPFELRLGRLGVKVGFDLPDSPYFALLAISIAHAWNVDCEGTTPEAALESVVSAALGTRMASVGLGTGDRQGITFVENLQSSAAELGLTASNDPRPRRVRAKDSGVDTLAGYVWADRRPGHWLFIGQVTCGRTNTWSEKLCQPKPAIWRSYLQEPITPRPFLAVPHHVDGRFFSFLHQADTGIVLDRLRLALTLECVTGPAAAVVAAILAAVA